MNFSHILEKADKRIKQKIKILVNRPDFQEIIIDLRNKWAIPYSGLKNEEDIQNWNQKLNIDTANYYSKYWPKEKDQIIKLRENRKFTEAEEIRKRISSQAPFNILDDDIWSIVRKQRLSPRWHHGIYRYLLFNDPQNMDISVGITVKYIFEHGIRRTLLEIDDDTTLNDLKCVWSWARKTSRNNPAGKCQPIKNFDRDKRAYELQHEGKLPTEIENTIEEEFGAYLDDNELNMIIKRYKKRLNIN